MNSHAKHTKDRLTRWSRSRSQLFRALRGSTGLYGAVLIVALLATLDYVFIFGANARWGLLAIGAAALGLALGRIWRRWPRRSDTREAALAMEADDPKLGVVVSTSMEYSAESRPDSRSAPESVERKLHQESARRVASVSSAPFTRRMRRISVSMATLIVLLAVTLGSIPSARIAAQRALLPSSVASYTRFAIDGAEGPVAEGAAARLSGKVSGRFADQTRIQWRRVGEADWKDQALALDVDGHFDFDLMAEAPGVEYQLVAGRSESDRLTLAVYAPTEVADVEWLSVLPDYTSRDPVRSAGWRVEALRASATEMQARFSNPVQSATVVFEDDRSLPLVQSDASEVDWRVNAPTDIVGSFDYWIEFTDIHGRKGSTDDAKGTLRILEDKAPTVAIVSPGMDSQVQPQDRPEVMVAAEDDYGVNEMTLVYRKLGQPEQRRVIEIGSPTTDRLEASVTLDLAEFDLKEYELVAYYAEVRDFNDIDGPGVAKSPVYFFEYTTGEKLLSRQGGSCSKTNLLDVQKQILAAITATEAGNAEPLAEISAAQRRALELAAIYEQGYRLQSAPEKAREEFELAERQMTQTADHLDAVKRTPALATAEAALATLYRVVALLPELEASMCNGKPGQCQKIVLEALEKTKMQKERERGADLKRLLSAAKKLMEIQERLNDQLASGAGASQSSGQGRGQNSSGQGRGQNSSGQNSSGQGRGENSSAQAQGRQSDGAGLSSDELNMLANEQAQVGDGTDQILNRLRELAKRGPGSAVRPEMTQAVEDAAREFRQVSEKIGPGGAEIGSSELKQAAIHGQGGVSQLREFTILIEAALFESEAPTTTQVEWVPEQYAASAAEYLRRLSFDSVETENGP